VIIAVGTFGAAFTEAIAIVVAARPRIHAGGRMAAIANASREGDDTTQQACKQTQ
jgi:hypothetical protein